MSKFEKGLNKMLIGAVLGTAIIGVGGFSMSKTGKKMIKGLFKKASGLKNFLKEGYEDLKKETGLNEKKKQKKTVKPSKEEE